MMYFIAFMLGVMFSCCVYLYFEYNKSYGEQ